MWLRIWWGVLREKFLVVTMGNSKANSENNGDCNWVTRHFRGDSIIQNFCDWMFDASSKVTTVRPAVFLLSGNSSWLQKLFICSFGGKKFGKSEEFANSANLAEKLLRVSGAKKFKIKLGNASLIKFKLALSDEKNLFGKTVHRCVVQHQSTQLVFGNWQVHGHCNEGNTEICQKLKTSIEDSAKPEPQPGDAVCPWRLKYLITDNKSLLEN